MMSTENRTKLIEIFRAVLDLDSDEAAASAEQANEERWDSLNHVRLILAIESEFDIEVDLAESMAQSSFASAAQLLEARGFAMSGPNPES